jgi:hypothetical protein
MTHPMQKTYKLAEQLEAQGSIVINNTHHTIESVRVTPKRGWIVLTLGNQKKVSFHPRTTVKVA